MSGIQGFSQRVGQAAMAAAQAPCLRLASSPTSACQRASSVAPAPQRLRLQKEFSGAPVLASAAAATQQTHRPSRGLCVEAAKRVQTGRSLVLNSTLIAEKGKEEEVAKLCKSVMQLAEDKKVRLQSPPP